jgi:hypothetical protein
MSTLYIRAGRRSGRLVSSDIAVGRNVSIPVDPIRMAGFCEGGRMLKCAVVSVRKPASSAMVA